MYLTIDKEDIEETLANGRLMVYIDTEDVLCECFDSDIEEEANKRGLFDDDGEEVPGDYTRDDFIEEASQMNDGEFRRLLCDLTGNMYCVSDEQLLNDIKRRL